MSTLDLLVATKSPALRRVEVITGVERRRRWSIDEKARVLDETIQPGAVISEIARRNGLTPQQLFTWRRQARRVAARQVTIDAPAFVPAIVDNEIAASTATGTAEASSKPAPVLELEIGGSSVWIWREAKVELVTAIIRALKASR